ncbi:MAG TPA: hypothetical protein VLU47_09990 [Blastocatellia bacterium]|nr:hypothetical protein [Blastocatellia bacterium]
MQNRKGKPKMRNSAAQVDAEYERLLSQIFAECAEEDIALANAGLGDYVRLLNREDEKDAEPTP